MDSKQQDGGKESHTQYQDTTNNRQQDGIKLPRRPADRQTSLWQSVHSPLELMARIDDDMDRLLGRFWSGGRGLGRNREADTRQTWVPQVDVFERDGKLHIHADLPGLNKEDVRISVDDGHLLIQGERSSNVQSGGEPNGYFYAERTHGGFSRSIPLPDGVDLDTAEASFENGVLKVHFLAPPSRQDSGRKIEIR